MMKLRLILFLLIAASLPLVVFSPVLGHAALLRSDPPVGATVDSSPAEVLTWFSSPLRTGSVIRVMDDQFRDVSRIAAVIDPNDATLMRLGLAPLGPGQYTVNWKAIAQDGDISSGSFSFIIREPAMPLPLPILAIMVLLTSLIVFSLALIARFRKSDKNR